MTDEEIEKLAERVAHHVARELRDAEKRRQHRGISHSHDRELVAEQRHIDRMAHRFGDEIARALAVRPLTVTVDRDAVARFVKHGGKK